MSDIRAVWTPKSIDTAHTVSVQFKKGGVLYNVSYDIRITVEQLPYAKFEQPVYVTIDHEGLARRLQDLCGVRLGKDKERELIDVLIDTVPDRLEIAVG